MDALLMNVDRTARNTNMLMFNRELWLIDHGAALYFHHSMENWEEQAKRPFVQIKDHVLLRKASELDEVDTQFKALLTPEFIQSVVDLIPDAWLTDRSFETEDEQRQIYAKFLNTRLANSNIFVTEAQHARQTLI
jgi:hypothetical protein